MEEQIPTFKYVLNKDFSLTCISAVEAPAVERNYEFYAKNVDRFTVQDGNIVGCAVLCGVPILRMTPWGEPYNILFDKETCDNLTQQILRKGLDLTFDHEDMDPVHAKLTGVFQTSKAVKFQDLPDGSIVVSYAATPEVIEEVKKRNGFSVELYYGALEPFNKVDECLALINEISKSK